MDVFGMSVSGRSVGTMVLDFFQTVEGGIDCCSGDGIADVGRIAGAEVPVDIDTDNLASAAHNDSYIPSSDSQDLWSLEAAEHFEGMRAKPVPNPNVRGLPGNRSEVVVAHVVVERYLTRWP